jgi:D-alanyl-lipoteichoic acid acyltransferase DltB (MBOAT superfamily)
MLFNSYMFILGFLPVCLLGYGLTARYAGKRPAIIFLTLASAFFYGWWNPPYLLLIFGSILLNYSLGRSQGHIVRRRGGARGSRVVLALGVAINLGVLAYFKYANFFVRTASDLLHAAWTLDTIFLPLAISFFTFTQIAYLVDAYTGEASEYNFIDYSFFVLFFPHLIAGPIVRHHEILPQVHRTDGLLRVRHLTVGLTVFALGLAKKVLLADPAGTIVAESFGPVELTGEAPRLLQAWAGALAYTCQLYFDFSGYSDMAVGLGCMFGIKMPLNFNSPYKARSIAEFWRRWHISLSRFLRDYLYIPLGGNRKGKVRQYANLMTTMLLGGLWHGAGWTFVFWGGLHGLYLCVNHAWSRVSRGWGWAQSRAAGRAYHLITFLAVVVSWVFFRAKTFGAAVTMVKGMLGFNGIALPYAAAGWVKRLGLSGVQLGFTGVGLHTVTVIAALLAIAFTMPNTQEITRLARPTIERVFSRSRLVWRPSLGWGVAVGLVLSLAMLRLNRVSEFLYFQF